MTDTPERPAHGPRQTADLIDGYWVVRDMTEEEAAIAFPAPPPPPEPEPDPKLIGVEFEGVMCSATAQDQNGLAAVFLAIQIQGASFQPTRFYFDNGNTLVISLDNYEAFAAVWLPFRQSFFQP